MRDRRTFVDLVDGEEVFDKAAWLENEQAEELEHLQDQTDLTAFDKTAAPKPQALKLPGIYDWRAKLNPEPRQRAPITAWRSWEHGPNGRA